MEKFKEKPARSGRIKEKVVSAPKELLHKGLDDGADRLRTQLRDTVQQGRRDEYGGDDIEDTAVSGSKRAATELLKQRKQKATEQPSDPARNGASARMHTRMDPHHPNQRYRVRRDPNACCDAPGTSAPRCDAESGSRQDEGHLYRNTGENKCHSSTGAAAARTAGVRPRTGAQGDAADEASADGAEQTASEYITRSRHFGNDRYSSKMRRIFHTKVLKRGPTFHYRKSLKKRF